MQEGSGLQESNNMGSPAAKFNLMTAPNISAENQSTQMVTQIASQMLNDMQGKLVLWTRPVEVCSTVLQSTGLFILTI